MASDIPKKAAESGLLSSGTGLDDIEPTGVCVFKRVIHTPTPAYLSVPKSIGFEEDENGQIVAQVWEDNVGRKWRRPRYSDDRWGAWERLRKTWN